MPVGHTLRYALLITLQVLIVGTLFVLLLVLAERHNQRFDLSPTQRFSLADASRNVAAGLTVPVRVTAFYNSQEEGQRRGMEDVLELFAKASPNITYRLVDLDRSPALAQKYGVSAVNTGVLESEGKTSELRMVDEEEIINGLLKLTRRGTRKLCFISGHGEHDPYDNDERSGYSEVGKALEKENFEIASLPSVPTGGVPADCSVVIMAGPTRQLFAGEADQLARHIDSGGRALILVDPRAPDSVVDFLKRFDVRAGNDVVLDERNRLMGTDSSMLNVPALNKGVFRTELDAAVFPVARTILPIDDDDDAAAPAAGSKHQIVALALSSPDSWAYVNGGALPDGDVRFRRDVDQPGPLPVGLMVTNRSTNGQTAGGRLIVFGDSDFATNLSLNWRGNKDLMMSSIALLAEDPTLIAVRRKAQPGGSISPIYLTESQDSVVFWVATVAVPGTFAVVGLVLTAIRRRRASR